MAENTPENSPDVSETEPETPPDVSETELETPSDVSETEQETPPAVKKVTLKTVEGIDFEVEEAIAKEFVTLKSFIEEEDYSDSPIPLPNVSCAALVKIIEFCQEKIEFRAKAKPLDRDKTDRIQSANAKAFEDAFVKDMTNDDIKELMLAANYLNVKELLDFLSECVANRIKNKSVEFVRAFFGIESDYSEEEEAALRQDYAWAFEGVDED